MRVEFAFDKNRVEQGGYAMGDIYHTIQKLFAGRNIPCVSDGDTLAFEANGGKNDYSNMLVMMMRLTRAD